MRQYFIQNIPVVVVGVSVVSVMYKSFTYTISILILFIFLYISEKRLEINNRVYLLAMFYHCLLGVLLLPHLNRKRIRRPIEILRYPCNTSSNPIFLIRFYMNQHMEFLLGDVGCHFLHCLA